MSKQLREALEELLDAFMQPFPVDDGDGASERQSAWAKRRRSAVETARAALSAPSDEPVREREALQAIMRQAGGFKEPCSTDPESPAAIRNVKFATLAAMAAQGLGLVTGPAFSAAPSDEQAPAADARAVPLTDEQIASLWYDYTRTTDPFQDEGAEFARAIEAAHGVKP